MKGKNRDGWQGGAPARGSTAQDTHCSLASMDVWMDECIWQFDSAEIPLLLTCHIHGLQPFPSLATRGCVCDCLLFCYSVILLFFYSFILHVYRCFIKML